jgi:hypothetical protein
MQRTKKPGLQVTWLESALFAALLLTLGMIAFTLTR